LEIKVMHCADVHIGAQGGVRKNAKLKKARQKVQNIKLKANGVLNRLAGRD
jgi:hypothetical protein